MKFRKIVGLSLALLLIVQCMVGVQLIVQPVQAEEITNQSRMLKVNGNQVVFADDESCEVVLSGVNIPGAIWSWTPAREKVLESTVEAIGPNWNSNLIRLGVSTNGWFGNYASISDGGAAYRTYIDTVINEVSKAGKYVVLDLHEFSSINSTDINFWKDAAVRYANNPTVLFGIFNESTVAWSTWKSSHQQLIETIRDLGAKNIIIAGGRNYANDLTGVVNTYALLDQGSGGDGTKTGNGIMYDLHMYPWHGGVAKWDANAGEARKKYPILMGDFGWDAGTNQTTGGGKTYYPGDQQYYDKWLPEIFEWMDDVARYGNHVSWTAYSFHPSAGPRMLDATAWSQGLYQPTDYFGTYVKEALKNRLGQNVALGKQGASTTALPDYPPALALDGNASTFWFSNITGDKYLQVDLGETMLINRYLVTHSTAASTMTTDFKLQTSLDGEQWTDVDSITNNVASLTDRLIPPTQARYARLYITKGSPSGDSARIYEFSVIGKDSRVLAPITPPGNTNGDGPYFMVKQERDFTAATIPKFDYWSSSDSDAMQISYPAGTAEDGVSTALHMTGGVGDTKESVIGLSAALGDFRGVAQWNLRMKSTVDLKLKFVADYRVSKILKTTNIITLPSTGGVWKDVSFSIESLMPTLQDTWVKEMYTKFTTNFEPIVQLVMIGSLGSNYVDISDIQSMQYQNGYQVSFLQFSNGGIVCNDALKPGKTDISIKLMNEDNIYANDILLCTEMYRKGSNDLVSKDTKSICIPPNLESQAHQLSVTMPNGENAKDYYIKVSVSTSKSLSNPFAEADYFKDLLIKHAITFIVDGVAIAARSVIDGETLTDIPSIPKKLGYTGVWDRTDFSNITSDLTVNAIYTTSSCDVLDSVIPANAAIEQNTITANVENGIENITVDVTTSANATWKLYRDEACIDEITDKTMALAVGGNTAYIKVTAADGITGKMYALTVTRNGIMASNISIRSNEKAKIDFTIPNAANLTYCEFTLVYDDNSLRINTEDANNDGLFDAIELGDYKVLSHTPVMVNSQDPSKRQITIAVQYDTIGSYPEESLPARLCSVQFDLNSTHLPENIPVALLDNTPEQMNCYGVDMNGNVVAFNNPKAGNITVLIQSVLSISVTGPSSIVENKQTAAYSAEILPDYATNKSVQWSVSDPAIASIDDNGVLTPLANGTVDVIATALDGSNVTGRATVAITGQKAGNIASLNIAGVTPSPTFAEDIYSYTARVLSSLDVIEIAPNVPADCTYEIRKDGAIISDGNVSLTEGLNRITIIVKKPNLSDVVYSLDITKGAKVKTITVNGNDSITGNKETASYTVACLPIDADITDVDWSVSNTAIASIDANGLLTPLTNGTVDVIATAKDGSHITGQKTVTISGRKASLVLLTAASGIMAEPFSPDHNNYNLYVPQNASSIVLKPTFSGGTLRNNGMIWANNFNKTFNLAGINTEIKLELTQSNLDTATYTITVIKAANGMLADGISVYDNGQSLNVLPEQEGSYSIQTTYVNNSSESCITYYALAIMNDNALENVMIIPKTFAPGEAYTFKNIIDIPSITDAPGLKLKAMLLKDFGSLAPYTDALTLSR